MSEEEKLDKIAQEIIDYSDGSFNKAVIEDYEDLNVTQQNEVDDIVDKEISTCGNCGWFFRTDSLEASVEFDEQICWQCADTERQEAELEEDD